MKVGIDSSNEHEYCALLGNLKKRVNESVKHEECALVSKKYSKFRESSSDIITEISKMEIPSVKFNCLSFIDESSIKLKNEPINIIYDHFIQGKQMDTTTLEGSGKIKSFDDFDVACDLDDVTEKAATPAIITLDFKGNVVHDGLKGTNTVPVNGATTVEMNRSKELAMKRLAEFISSYHGNNQQTIKTKGD